MIFRHLHNLGGFFSDYYLGTVFGRGAGRGRRRQLADRETDRAFERFRRLWERAEGRCATPAEVREQFARAFLRDMLGYHLGSGQDGTHGLFPTAQAEVEGERPIGLAAIGPWDEGPDAPAARGRKSLAALLGEALSRAGIRYGLVVTGTCLRLIRRPGDGPRAACLELDVPGCLEEADAESFAAAYRIFGAARFIPRPDGSLPIDEDEKESREHAQKVSEDLKRAVFQAAEALVQGLMDDWAARAPAGEVRDTTRLAEHDLPVFRDAALMALYRLLFILYAEARDERLHAHALYRDSYSLSALVEEILTAKAEGLSANRFGFWARLLALFRIYDDGLPAITPYEHIPPRGGDFFSPRTPAGHLLEAIRLDDRTVGRLLLDLTTTVPRQGVGRERVSFRELDIEQLGAVYEGLLEFEPRVARETTIEVRVQGRPFAVDSPNLVRLCREKDLALTGDPTIVAGLPAAELHPDLAPDEGEDEEDLDAEAQEAEEDEDVGEAEETGIARGATARLLRRLEPGSFYFAPGTARKGSGSFYTPRPLVDDLVRHALGPLVEGRTAVEIEALRVLDPATGSAHFLVGAMRFLGQALHAAHCKEYGDHGPPHFRGRWGTDFRVPDREARAANSEARAWCKRRVAERCLFGVDLNPTAVNLARVSLWIESLAGDRPLTYFEHHIRCGNSLLGTWLDRLGVPPLPGMGDPVDPHTAGLLFAHNVKEAVRTAAARRLLIDTAADEGAVLPESIDELRYKEDRRREAEETLAAARLLFDLRCASAFELPEIWAEFPTLLSLASDMPELTAHCQGRPWWGRFEAISQRERFFHWELEFPEIFFAESPDFDAVLGNPPWDKVLPSKHEFYVRYDPIIRAYKGNELERRIRELHAAGPALQDEFNAYQRRTTTIAHLLRRGGDFPLSEARSQHAHEDVSKYFVDRAARLARTSGLVVPSVVYNGDGCVAIRRFLLNQCVVQRFYGFENRKKIFPIDSRYKFVNLVFRKGDRGDGFEAAFMRHEMSELEDRHHQPWIVRLTRKEVEALSPDTLAFLEYRSPRDQEIVRKMHQGRPTLGSDGPGSWGATFVSWRAHEGIYNASEDKDLWTDPATGALYSPSAALGHEPKDPGEAIERMREKGFWPVFEGKHIDQFLVGIKPVRWWLSVEAAQRKYGKPPRPEPTLMFRETASNTNERTCIAAVLPPSSVASHKLSGIRLANVSPDAAATVLNSLCFDYALRMRTPGTNISFTYMRPIPVLPFHLVNRLPTLPTHLAWASGMDHITDTKELWPLLWDANRAVAEGYGLTPDDFEHILNAFPVFARKRPAFFAYLQERLAGWRHPA